MNNDLFRRDAIDAQQHKWTGNIILSRPFSFTYLAIFALIISIVIVAFFIWGNYTKRSTVKGQLVPQSGFIQVYTPQAGTIIKKYVYEGKVVKKGDILYVLAINNYGENGDPLSAISDQIKLKDQSIRNEINHMNIIHRGEKETTINQINSLNSTINRMNSSIDNLHQRVNLAKKSQDRYQSMVSSGAISQEEFELKKASYLELLSQYETLQREKISLQNQLNEQQVNLRNTQSKQKNEIEQLERLLLSNNQELIETKLRQHITIHAGVSGVVSTKNIDVGQYVDTTRSLVSILPEKEPFIVEMYVNNQAIGFVNERDEVLLRYTAYPYQKFGHAKARIVTIAKNALPAEDFNSISITSSDGTTKAEQQYLVRAKLEKQTIKAYGKELPLRAGMTLEGDILHENRKLYEWVLEPLFTITGKL